MGNFIILWEENDFYLFNKLMFFYFNIFEIVILSRVFFVYRIDINVSWVSYEIVVKFEISYGNFLCKSVFWFILGRFFKIVLVIDY